MKRTIRLTESELHNIIKESVNILLQEKFGVDFEDTIKWVRFKRPDMSREEQERFAQNIINKTKRNSLINNQDVSHNVYQIGKRGLSNNNRKFMLGPHHCYAVGALEKDLGFDMFDIVKDFSCNVYRTGFAQRGTYNCIYNNRPCILFVGYGRNGSEGRCCYSDDKQSISDIKRELGI